jgi:hypothetical protein
METAAWRGAVARQRLGDIASAGMEAAHCPLFLQMVGNRVRRVMPVVM